MTLISLFAAQRAAFEDAYESGNWHPLATFFADDMVYEVMNMPFHCVLRGKEAILAGLRRSIERFDKLCTRTVGIESTLREEGRNVLINSGILFERAGAPPLATRLWEIATYEGDKVSRLIDIYDPADHQRFAVWMEEWGKGLDPAYA